MSHNMPSEHAVTEEFDAEQAGLLAAKAAHEAANEEHNKTIQLRNILTPSEHEDDSSFDDSAAEDDLIMSATHGKRRSSASSGSTGAPVRGSSSSTEEEVSDDVDELTSYMESFLQRMKCNSGSAGAPAASGTSGKSADPAKPASSTAESKKDSPQNAGPKKEKREYAGPKAAPECKDRLAVMRELANATTRSSLSQHAAGIGKRTGQSLVVSAVCCAMSIGLASYATEMASYAFAGAVSLFVVAIFTGWRYQQGISKLSASKRPASKEAKEQLELAEQLAAEEEQSPE